MSFKKLNMPALATSQDDRPRQELASVPAQQGSPPALATLKAGQLFGCYRKADANDPEVYVAAAASVLAEYPPEVVEYVCDPRTGLARRLKWLPTIAEIAEECQTRADINRMRAQLRGKDRA